MSPDISKCSGFNCPWKKKCYRFTAPPSEYWQAYMSQPGHKVGRKWVCEYLWEVEPAKVQK